MRISDWSSDVCSSDLGPSIVEGFATALGATIPSGFGGTTINSNAPAKDVYTTKNLKGTLEWKVSDYVTVTSITNYTDFRDRYQLDGDGTPFGSNAPVGERYPNSSSPFQSLVSGDQ